MANEQTPSVEIAPTVIISNSEGTENAGSENSSDEAHSDGNSSYSGSSLDTDAIAQSEGVAIAAIEAERDITLAAIHSDVERERIELEGERIEAITESNEELEACRREIAELTVRVETLANLLIPPPQLVEEMTEELPIVLEPDLIHPSMQAPIVETMTEPSDESVEERVEEAIPSRVRRFIAI